MHKKTEMKREKSPYTPLKSKAKGKELSPELLVCSLSPRACARTRKGPARYRLAGEAAEALINILGGAPSDHTLWAYYCYDRDAREGATFYGSSLPATRMYAALDWEHVDARRQKRIAAALKKLKPADRSFANAILKGLGYRDLKISKQLFSYKMKKILKVISAR